MITSLARIDFFEGGYYVEQISTYYIYLIL
jgi:hypothetical protein